MPALNRLLVMNSKALLFTARMFRASDSVDGIGRDTNLSVPSPVTPEFIQEHLRISRTSLTPELALHLATPLSPLYWSGEATERARDPWWAIYWPGGQVMARYLLDNPDTVKGKSVLDLGSGCGAVSIAAKRSGASKVIANDIDPDCLTALSLNASLNGLGRDDFCWTGVDLLATDSIPSILDEVDVLLIGDMFYDADLGSSLLNLCSSFSGLASRADRRQVYVGDPGRWVTLDNTAFSTSFLCQAKYLLGEDSKRDNTGLTQGFLWKHVQ